MVQKRLQACLKHIWDKEKMAVCNSTGSEDLPALRTQQKTLLEPERCRRALGMRWRHHDDVV